MVDVYFDDLTLTHTQSSTVAGADYYPFGLVMVDREITDENYRYGYQGQYSEEQGETGWNSFELRMYDPRFGRWISPDPYGQFASPYVGMGNSPVSSADPDGGWIGPVVGGPMIAAIGAIASDPVGIFKLLGGTVLNEIIVKPGFWMALGQDALCIAKDFGDFVTSERILQETKRTFLGATSIAASINRGYAGDLAPRWDGKYDDFGIKMGEALSIATSTMVPSAGALPGGSPVAITPTSTLVPITAPKVVPTTRVTDVHGTINAESSQWGWTGTQTWKQLVKRVAGGGTIKDLNGKIPTKAEAIKLIQEGGGKIDRIEAGHAPPNPHQYNHINLYNK